MYEKMNQKDTQTNQNKKTCESPISSTVFPIVTGSWSILQFNYTLHI